MFDLKLGDPIDFELDFDLGDFNLVEPDGDEPKSRILAPRMNAKNVCQHVAYKNAREMARKIDLREGCRTFAWVSGDFIFGDLLEALILEKHISPKKIYICSLGMSQENIDSLENIIKATKLEKLTILLSGYFYSHEKERLIPYLYEHLDVGAFPGHFFTIHGSANMRSSNSIEQIMVEEGEELYRFNAGIMDEQASLYGTIDHTVESNYYIRRGEAWRAVAEDSSGTMR